MRTPVAVCSNHLWGSGPMHQIGFSQITHRTSSGVGGDGVDAVGWALYALIIHEAMVCAVEGLDVHARAYADTFTCTTAMCMHTHVRTHSGRREERELQSREERSSRGDRREREREESRVKRRQKRERKGGSRGNRRE